MIRVSLHRTAAVCLLGALAVAGCSKDESPSNNPTTPTPAGVTSYSVAGSWTCATGASCQDVYDLTLTTGSTVTIKTSAVTGSSVSQLGLYGPGVALGGTNLLTGTANEYRCIVGSNCDGYASGESKTVTVTQTGTYRVAVTRDWGRSCDSGGNYRLDVTSTVSFQTGTQTADNQASLAPGSECK